MFRHARFRQWIGNWNGESKESSATCVDKGRHSHNEDDGQSENGRLQDCQGVKAHTWRYQRDGCETWRIVIDAQLVSAPHADTTKNLEERRRFNFRKS